MGFCAFDVTLKNTFESNNVALFQFVCRHYGDSVFYLTGIMDKRMEWSQDMTKFRAWKEGRTGVPFIDANMREMKETGTK